MRLPAHLFRHASGIYYFRLVIPGDLRAIVGRSEVRRSLATRDWVAARRFAYYLGLVTAPLIERVRETGTMDEETRRKLMGGDARSLLGNSLEVGYHPKTGWLVKSDPADPADGERALEALRLIISGGRPAEPGGPPGQAPDTPPAISEAAAEPEAGAAKISRLIDQHLALNGGKWAAATRIEYEGVLRRFAGFLGRRQLARVTGAEIADYLEWVSERVKAERGSSASPYTLDKQVKALSGFFKHCQRVKAYPVGPLPTEGQGLKKRERKQLARRSGWQKFHTSDLLRIFAPESLRARTKPHEFWLPILGFHTLGRIEELCQLRVKDVVEYASGQWMIVISDEGDSEKSLKTEASKRNIPLLDCVVDIGFIDYVREIGAAYGADSRIFPYLRRDAKGKYSDVPSEAFSRYKKSVGVMGTKQVFHSYRETGNQLLTDARVPDSVLDTILGHQSESTRMEHYTPDGHPAANLKFWMDQALVIPGFDFACLAWDREAVLSALRAEMMRRERFQKNRSARSKLGKSGRRPGR